MTNPCEYLSTSKIEHYEPKFYTAEQINALLSVAKPYLYKPDYVSRKFAKILADNNLPPIRFHDLRHSCASLLVAQGFALKNIQEWLRYSDIQTTANIYAHLDDERKKSISKAMTSSLHIQSKKC